MINITKSKMNEFNYKRWLLYFSDNDLHRLKIDFSKETGLSGTNKRLIFPSIKAFQKGEGSDGRYLMKTVEDFVNKSGLTEYKDVMQLFVREENYHSLYLKEYMDYYKIKPAKHSALDFIFRKLRGIGGLKSEIITLVTAEIIALTYYDALSKCVRSQALESICRQMLHDELAHIIFQSHTLRQLKLSAFDNLVRIILMEITSIFVWCAFCKVFKAGGYSFNSFLKENIGYLKQSVFLIKNGVDEGGM